MTALLWIIFFNQYWKRMEQRLAYRWGTEDFEEEEGERREFLFTVQKATHGFYTKEGWFVSKKDLQAWMSDLYLQPEYTASGRSLLGRYVPPTPLSHDLRCVAVRRRASPCVAVRAERTGRGAHSQTGAGMQRALPPPSQEGGARHWHLALALGT